MRLFRNDRHDVIDWYKNALGVLDENEELY